MKLSIHPHYIILYLIITNFLKITWRLLTKSFKNILSLNIHLTINSILYYMIIQDPSENSINLSRKEALKLELRLNISEYGNLWSELGDTLYDYAIEKSTPKIMSVSTFQFIVLKNFYNELFPQPQ